MLLKGKEFKEHPCGLFVASDGEVYCPQIYRTKCHFTYGNTNTRGYKRVKRNHKTYAVHRLVAECWIPNTSNLPTVDHINRDKTDNRVENLRWADYSLQQHNSVKPNHIKQPLNNKHSKKVLQVTLEGQIVKEWPSTMECERNGFCNGCISDCCNGKRKTHKGFMWEYAD